MHSRVALGQIPSKGGSPRYWFNQHCGIGGQWPVNTHKVSTVTRGVSRWPYKPEGIAVKTGSKTPRVSSQSS